MGLFGGGKDWNVIGVLFEKKGHVQINGNRAKGANAEKVRDAVKRHPRAVFWAVFNQKRTFVEGGPGRGQGIRLDRGLSVHRTQSGESQAVAQILTMLEQGKTDKAATGWEVALQTKSSDDGHDHSLRIMIIHFGPGRIRLVQGDITARGSRRVVNAANARLAGGGGVDGAIHRAAGPSLMEETRRRYPQGCPTGDAVATSAGNLRARYVFHAVGPVWRGGMQQEAKLLASAYRRCLELALEHECRSIAFPAISTGVYSYPTDLAADCSLKTVRDFLLDRAEPLEARFVLFDAGTYGAFARVLESMAD